HLAELAVGLCGCCCQIMVLQNGQTEAACELTRRHDAVHLSSECSNEERSLRKPGRLSRSPNSSKSGSPQSQQSPRSPRSSRGSWDTTADARHRGGGSEGSLNGKAARGTDGSSGRSTSFTRRLWTGRSRSVNSGTEALRRLKGQLEKHKDRLKIELEEGCKTLTGWRSRLRSPEGRSERIGANPVLVAVEPIVSAGQDADDELGCHYCGHVEYRAHLELRLRPGEGHSWQTEPFTLDELLAIVVKTRLEEATRWCSVRPRSRTGEVFVKSGWEAHVVALRGLTKCVVKSVAFWGFCAWAAWFMAGLLRPLVHFALDKLETAIGGRLMDGGGLLPLDLLLAWFLSTSGLSLSTLLLAGLAEVSFLPAKAILKLERKAETEKVKEQLELLLRSTDCTRNLDVCNFLSLGMATYYNSSETQKEGLCFCRRHETSQDYFMQRRRRRFSLGCMRCDCRCQMRLAGRSEGGLKERWLVLRKDGIALFSSVMDSDPTDMLFFDTSFTLFRDEEDHVLVRGASWVLELVFADQGSRRQSAAQSWCNAITVTAQLSSRTREQRFGSFAPLRMPAASKAGDRHLLRRSMARYLINGREICREVAEAFMMARHEIFVLSFFLTATLPLLRDGETLPGVPDTKVSTLLRHAADRGVRVYVLLFHETLLPNCSEMALSELKHPNIFVARHRSRFDSNLLWTHHEKVIVVDQQYAIVGGLDICLGRYDDHRHRVSDAKASTWQGQDYYNPRIKDVTDGTLQTDLLDRQKHPRLPWQDVACALLGRPARDVARHCVERWNHARSKSPQYASLPTALLRRKVAVSNDLMMSLPSKAGDRSWPPEFGTWQDCSVQVVRSVGRWSAGTKTETSPHQAYCGLIQDSRRFIYIENQFFCSGFEGDEAIGNRVVEALYTRIVKAHELKEPFHVMIVLPLLPAIEGDMAQSNAAMAIFRVMHAQYSTLRGLRTALRSKGLIEADYFSVFGLRTHGQLEASGASTEQIYVHSKAMVVDDEVAVIGSTNINDRSLLGVRDSEVNVILQDHGNSKGHMGGGCAANLRKALFAQHMGWSKAEVDSVYLDCFSKETLSEMRKIARNNTDIYEDLFGTLPSDKVRTWAEVVSLRAKGFSESREAVGDVTRFPSELNAVRLQDVRGHLVEFPLDFLADEDLSPNVVRGLMGAVFT
ncbi:unnamed protein product, partial [Polarella glacialis]